MESEPGSSLSVLSRFLDPDGYFGIAMLQGIADQVGRRLRDPAGGRN
jgi:hypothetical protein